MSTPNTVWEVTGIAKVGNSNYEPRTFFVVAEDINEAVQNAFDLQLDLTCVKKVGDLWTPPAVV